MNAIETLSRLDDLRRELHFQKEKILSLQESAGYLSPGYEDAGGGKGGPSDRVGKMAAMIADEKAKLEELEGAYAAAVGEAAAIISGLHNPAEKQILLRRYVVGMSWRKIARVTGHEINYCFILHRNALKRLKSIVD